MEHLTASINGNGKASRKSYTTEQKMVLLSEYKEFDGSLSEFCQFKDLARVTFRGWINKEHLITAHSSDRRKRRIYTNKATFQIWS